MLLFRLKQMSWLDRQYNLKPVPVKLKNNSIDETANLWMVHLNKKWSKSFELNILRIAPALSSFYIMKQHNWYENVHMNGIYSYNWLVKGKKLFFV